VPNKENAVIPAWSYDQVNAALTSACRYRYKANVEAVVRMVGLLFAPAEAPLAQEQVLPSLNYFHHRSGNNIDFFCAGYRRYGYGPEYDERPVTDDQPPWILSAREYDSLRREIERRSSWRYSGEVDLLLMNADFGGRREQAALNFKSAVVCDLDKMISDGAINSVRRFFEQIFQFAESASGEDPTWGFSDRMGIQAGGSALKRLLLSVLPRGLGDDYRRAEHFVIRDLSASDSGLTHTS